MPFSAKDQNNSSRRYVQIPHESKLPTEKPKFMTRRRAARILPSIREQRDPISPYFFDEGDY
jgi:hypothetical protein